MEQKKILWVAFIVGMFLLIVTGIAVLLYNVSDSRTSAIAAVQPPSDIWVRPVQPIENVPKTEPTPVTTTTADTLSVETIQADTITVKTLDVRNITNVDSAIAEQTAPIITTVQKQAPEKSAKPKAKSATTATPTAKKVPVSKKTPVAPAKKKAATAPAATTAYWIQAAAFTDKVKAEDARIELGKRLITPNIFTKEQDGTTYYRVRVGPYTTEKEAKYWHSQLKSIKGFEKCYITQTELKK